MRSMVLRHWQQRWTRLPLGLIIMLCLVASIGFAFMYSAAGGNWHPWAFRQVLHFLVFIPPMLAIALIDTRWWWKHAYSLYVGSLVLLVFVALQGHTAMGATRWIDLVFFKLQPSELAKITVILALARYFHQLPRDLVGRVYWLIPPAMIVLIPAALIAKQPDLGTALTLLMAGAAMFWLAGVRWWKFALIGIVVIGAIPAVWYSGKLHDYQKNRILTFLDPERDPLGTSYNIIQSKIAIGSGGFSGKGFLHGSQSQLSFLPEHQTDFIFTMYAEETGFGGAVFLLLLYGLMLAYGWMIGHRTRSYFSRLMAMGMSTLFFLHIFINIAMVMGMIPAVGAPLPLLSYGGTIMMATLVMFGFLMNAHVHHLSNL